MMACKERESVSGMQDAILLVNKLQDAASKAEMDLGELNLPQIVVIGEQSTGKSSVLENFVGRDFLPRGIGIVTRRPLVLQLHYNEKEEYGTFQHLEGKKFTDFLEIRQEIQNETDRGTQGTKGISTTPITLRIYSPNVLDLTLVDLPGIIQVSVGDQPPEITDMIKHMVMKYISKENTLILAVSPASQDIANSQAIKLSKVVDPEGNRTIGVVTKLDLMDKGTDARKILENKEIPLRYGFVGLVNRCQEDITNGKDIKLAQETEALFFKHHDAYKHMAHRMGTKHLQQLLNKRLCEHIQDKMPGIQAKVMEQHEAVRKELEDMQAFEEIKTESIYRSIIIPMLQSFSEEFKDVIEGHSVKMSGNQLNAGAQINHCINGQIFELLNQLAVPNEKKLKILIQNEHAMRNSLYPSELTFDIAVRMLLERYSEPVKTSVELISNILSDAIVGLSRRFENYPRLKSLIQMLMTDRLNSFEATTKAHLKLHLDAEAAFMNTKHPEFQRVVDPNHTADVKQKTSSQCKRLAHAEQPKAIHKEWICIAPSDTKEEAVWYWAVLLADSFTWFTADDETVIVASIRVEGLQVMVERKNDTDIYNLTRNRRPVSQDLMTGVAITFRNTTSGEAWCAAFRTAGIGIQINNNDCGANADTSKPRNLYDVVATDPEIQDNCNQMVIMVNSYMKIVDKTVHDLVPKYIILLLVNKTVEYTTTHLLKDVMDDNAWEDLLKLSPQESARRERLLATYTSTKEALEIMSSVNVL